MSNNSCTTNIIQAYLLWITQPGNFTSELIIVPISKNYLEGIKLEFIQKLYSSNKQLKISSDAVVVQS